MSEFLIELNRKQSSQSGSWFRCHELETDKIPFRSSLFVVHPEHESRQDSHSVRELWYVISGKGVANIGGTVFEIRKPHVVYIPPNIIHSVTNTDADSNLQIISVWFD